MPMTLKTQREIALSCARGQLRKLGRAPENESADTALLVIDELSRSQPDLVACIWFKSCSDAQIKAFCRDWNNWRAAWRRMISADTYHASLPDESRVEKAQMDFIEMLAPLAYHCVRCGRSGNALGSCQMPQPNGTVCDGYFLHTPLMGVAPENTNDSTSLP